jgi:hypothetical protein
MRLDVVVLVDLELLGRRARGRAVTLDFLFLWPILLA